MSKLSARNNSQLPHRGWRATAPSYLLAAAVCAAEDDQRQQAARAPPQHAKGARQAAAAAGLRLQRRHQPPVAAPAAQLLQHRIGQRLTDVEQGAGHAWPGALGHCLSQQAAKVGALQGRAAKSKGLKHGGTFRVGL